MVLFVPRVSANGLVIEYDSFGDRQDPAVLLIMGLGVQMTAWHPEFCMAIAEHGYFVIRFDNRDVGLSEKIAGGKVDLLSVLSAAVAGDLPEVPYLLSDMALDAVGVLDALDLESAHIVGASMGGMIAQQMAVASPERTRTLTSIMSTTGDPGVGLPSPPVASLLFRSPPAERSAAIEDAVYSARMTRPVYFDETEVREFAAASYDRSFYPEGTGRQLAAYSDRATDLRTCPD